MTYNQIKFDEKLYCVLCGTKKIAKGGRKCIF